MPGTYTCDFLLLYFVSMVIAVITAYTVSKKKLWIPVLFCIIAGFSLGMGFSNGDILSIVSASLFFSTVFAIAVVHGVRQVKHFREQSLTKLEKFDRDLTMDDLFKNGK